MDRLTNPATHPPLNWGFGSTEHPPEIARMARIYAHPSSVRRIAQLLRLERALGRIAIIRDNHLIEMVLPNAQPDPDRRPV